MRMRQIYLILSILCFAAVVTCVDRANGADQAALAAPTEAQAIGDGRRVKLRAPLTTVVSIMGTVLSGPSILHATIMAPDTLPTDVGAGGFVADRHGRWFQCMNPRPLVPGVNRFEFRLDASTALRGEPHYAKWNPSEAHRISQAGIFFWSAQSSTVELQVQDLYQEAIVEADPKLASPTLSDVFYAQQKTNGIIQITTGMRWDLSVMPSPFPVNPYNPHEFKLEAVFNGPDGKELRIPGFAVEPTTLIDRGDVQIGQPSGPCRFAVRWRPQYPGVWTGRIEASWGDLPPITVNMPSIQVAGEPWDDYVRNDKNDVRFFSVNGAWYWPVGVNLHSTFDQRSLERLGTVLTPERGTEAYAARFRRLASAGGNATEIWMASWNVALEWNASWPGYAGVGRYNQFNAAKLDRILDDAYANGIRINLVINNHGQASPNNDREWPTNPWNKINGGPLLEPYQLFSDEQAYIGQ